MTFTKKESNICKGIAIFLMIFHHLFNDYEEYAGYIVSYFPFTGERITYFALLSKICVAIFVFISGVGIAVTYEKNFAEQEVSVSRLGKFVWERYWKLMSAYWFVFILTLLCQPLGRSVIQAYGTNVKEIVLYLVIDFLGLSFLMSTPTLNPTWWYMTIAIAVICIAPIIIKLMKRYGAILVLTIFVIITRGNQLENVLNFYLFSMGLGIVCYELKVFERIERLGGDSKQGIIIKGGLELLILAGLLMLRTNYNFNGIVDGLIALVISLFVMTIVKRLWIVAQGLEFLGKYSSNIFLTHNQLYSYYFLGFFYSFKHWFVITLVLLGVSLLLSMVIEWVKDKSGYNNKMIRIGEKVINGAVK